MDRFVLLPANANWTNAARDVLSLGGIDAVTASTPGEAAELARENAAALVIDAGFAPLEEACALVRGAERTENLPLLVVVRDPLRDDLDRLFRLGIDDYLVAADIRQLRDRAVALSKGDPWTGLRAPAGRIVLADADRARRILIARIMRRWGFDLVFASNRDELFDQLRHDPPPRVALVDGDLPPDGATPALPAARREPRGRDVPWLLLVEPARSAAAQDVAKVHGPAAVYDRGGPPENMIFSINDLLQARGVEARRSARLLHSAPIALWTAGNDQTLWAYTYNINLTGLYVRTLVPPPVGTIVHVRFRPPHGEGLVAMEAQVMWRKELGSPLGPLYPPGVGIQFVRRPLADEAAHCAGYAELLREGERSGALRPSIGASVERPTVRVSVVPKDEPGKR